MNNTNPKEEICQCGHARKQHSAENNHCTHGMSRQHIRTCTCSGFKSATPAPTPASSPSESDISEANRILPSIQHETIKALLVEAIVSNQAIEVWALSSRKAPRPAGIDMHNLPEEIQQRVIKLRKDRHGIE